MVLATKWGKKWEEDDLPGINKAKSLGHPIIELSDGRAGALGQGRAARRSTPGSRRITEKGHPRQGSGRRREGSDREIQKSRSMH